MTFEKASDQAMINSLMENYRFNYETAYLFVSTKGICSYCGNDLFESLQSYSSSQIDHILPKSLYNQFSSDSNNLAICCSLCNSLKHNYKALKNGEDPKEMISKSRGELIQRISGYLKQPREKYISQYEKIKSMLRTS